LFSFLSLHQVSRALRMIDLLSWRS
jgi:hypothetical protein